MCDVLVNEQKSFLLLSLFNETVNDKTRGRSLCSLFIILLVLLAAAARLRVGQLDIKHYKENYRAKSKRIRVRWGECVSESSPSSHSSVYTSGDLSRFAASSLAFNLLCRGRRRRRRRRRNRRRSEGFDGWTTDAHQDVFLKI